MFIFVTPLFTLSCARCTLRPKPNTQKYNITLIHSNPGPLQTDVCIPTLPKSPVYYIPIQKKI